MANRFFLLWCFLLSFFSCLAINATAQEEPRVRVTVDLVQVNVAVTDDKGNYVTGLRPQDFTIFEDKIPEKIATFGEGNELTRSLVDAPDPKSSASDSSDQKTSNESSLKQIPAVAGSNVFILFDTSNYMYRGFVYAQDAIAEFVRSLDMADKIAFYSYSRDLSRASQLTSDRSAVLRSVRSTVAGDEAALYNSLLLTVKDASQYTGRKVVVVFSNGPDSASLVPPEDVAELAQSTGIVIYMISTRDAQIEPVSSAVFERMTKATGGKAYFAKNWKDERQAFASIRDDLAHLYSVSYYPKANPNRGWRTITVKLNGDKLKKYHIRTRNGYRMQPSQYERQSSPVSMLQSASQ